MGDFLDKTGSMQHVNDNGEPKVFGQQWCAALVEHITTPEARIHSSSGDEEQPEEDECDHFPAPFHATLSTEEDRRARRLDYLQLLERRGKHLHVSVFCTLPGMSEVPLPRESADRREALANLEEELFSSRLRATVEYNATAWLAYGKEIGRPLLSPEVATAFVKAVIKMATIRDDANHTLDRRRGLITINPSRSWIGNVKLSLRRCNARANRYFKTCVRWSTAGKLEPYPAFDELLPASYLSVQQAERLQATLSQTCSTPAKRHDRRAIGVLLDAYYVIASLVTFLVMLAPVVLWLMTICVGCGLHLGLAGVLDALHSHVSGWREDEYRWLAKEFNRPCHADLTQAALSQDVKDQVDMLAMKLREREIACRVVARPRKFRSSTSDQFACKLVISADGGGRKRPGFGHANSPVKSPPHFGGSAFRQSANSTVGALGRQEEKKPGDRPGGAGAMRP